MALFDSSSALKGLFTTSHFHTHSSPWATATPPSMTELPKKKNNPKKPFGSQTKDNDLWVSLYPLNPPKTPVLQWISYTSYLCTLVGEVASRSCWRNLWAPCTPKSRKRRASRWGWEREEEGESSCPPSPCSSSPPSSRGSGGRGTMRPASGESCASPLSLSSCQDLKAGTGSGEDGKK